MFRPNTLYYSDGYKTSHKAMLAPNTDFLYGTWIPRGLKHAPKGVTKILSIGQQLTVKWLMDEFNENFFNKPLEEAQVFSKDMAMYLGMEYDGSHFDELHKLDYLPIRIKSLPEGIATSPNVPHMTFVNTKSGFAWLTLYLETIISALSWKMSTNATIALEYRKNADKWVKKTDPSNAFLIDYMCHDFSGRGLDPFSMISSGLAHAAVHRGSDTLITIPAARYFYNEPDDEVCVNSVNASEHSVSTTKIFTVGEQQMLSDWMKIFPNGILSVVSDTFDLWKLVTEYLPALKDEILSRDGKLVIRPDSGDPVDIICGKQYTEDWFTAYDEDLLFKDNNGKLYELEPVMNFYPDHCEYEKGRVWSGIEQKGVIELLWEIFGGTVNEEGYKVLDPHIGCIYGDSITLRRQEEIYSRLATKGFAATNIVLGVGSYTYQYNTRDTFGFAAKGAWFEADGKGYDIYKDPITDDGTKKSLKGRCAVHFSGDEYVVATECSEAQEKEGALRVIFEDGKLHNQTTLTEIRNRINSII